MFPMNFIQANFTLNNFQFDKKKENFGKATKTIKR